MQPSAAGVLTRLRGSRFVQQSVLVFSASLFLNLCGFVFHALATRTLGVATYGTFASLISLFLLAALPFGILSPVVAKFAAEFRALQDDSHVRGLALGLARGCAIAGGAYVAASLVLAIPLAGFLHVPVWTIPLVGVFAAIGLCSAVFRAIAQGTQEYVAYAFSQVGEGIAKVAAVVVFGLLGWALFGATAAFIAGAALGFVVVAWDLHRVFGSTTPQTVRYDWKRIAIATAGSAALSIAVTLCSTADLVVVKHFFSGRDAGIYSVASLAGKILLYFVSFIPTVLIPQAADRHARGQRTRDVAFLACVVLVGFSALGLLGFHYFGLTLIHMLSGTQFDAAQPLLIWYAAAMASLAMLGALGAYGIATHRLAFGWVAVAGALLTIGAIAVMHVSLLSVVQILFVGNFSTALAAGIVIALQVWQSARTQNA